jgi:copper chaperone CopZ
MQALQLKIDGMTCGHCVARIERTLGKMEDVVLGKVLIGHAELFYDPARTSVARILAAIDDAGYDAQVVNAAEALA